MRKRIADVLLIILFLAALRPAVLRAEPSWDSERLTLEMTMQKRVEDSLAKILSPGQFVVVIRIDPLPRSGETAKPAEDPEGFFLPGVPMRKSYDGTAEQMQSLVQGLKPESKLFAKFIRRISATLVVDKDLPEDDVVKVRELTRQMLGLDPERGDTLDVQKSTFSKPIMDMDSNSGIFKLQKALRSYWLIISLALFLFCVAVFFLFIFGPLRGFLNQFVQVLPALRPDENRGSGGKLSALDVQALPAYMAQNYGLPPPPGYGTSAFSGSLHVENPNKNTLPFGFIREDHLGNLAILLSREAPEKAAVVLGYLPPDWISRVLGRMDGNFQTEVAAHLATTRQLLPEQVEDIEQDLKRRLDYLIGGPDRIFAVYESLDPEAQKRMLDSLRESRPDLAEELRHKTLLFEDLEKLDASALKAILREVDLQTIGLALRGTTESMRAKFLENMTPGKAEIVKEDLELTDGTVGRNALEAQRKLTVIAKRLEKEGQIQIPQVQDSLPASRYGGSLRSTLKLPPGLRLDETVRTDPPAAGEQPKDDIKERIRRFMNRRSDDKRERFPLDAGENPEEGK